MITATLETGEIGTVFVAAHGAPITDIIIPEDTRKVMQDITRDILQTEGETDISFYNGCHEINGI